MSSFETFLAFLLATSIFAYMPGPAMLYATAQTLARGQRAGWFAAFGIHIGGYVHVIAASFGLAILFKVVPILYTTLKFAGAAYLIWLGYRMFTSRTSPDQLQADPTVKSPRRAFWESVTVEVLNPKTALFFVAFLPQFIDPAANFPIWAQLLVLGTIVNFMFSSADAACILLADKIASRLRSSQSMPRWPQRVGGAILIGLGVKIALTKN